MNPFSKGWLAVLAVMLGAGAVVGRQRLALAELAHERTAAAESRRERREVEAERRRLAGLMLADEELERLRAAREAAARLESEVRSLRRERETRPTPTVDAANGEGRFATGMTVPAAAWQNAGAATSAAALETVLWAAAGGDVAEFASLLHLDPGARMAAAALLASLPEEQRSRHASPEHLLAFLAIGDVPPGQATVRDWSAGSDGRMTLATLILRSQDGAAKEARLVFLRQDAGWKLSVTEPVVARYAAMLKAGPPGEGK